MHPWLNPKKTKKPDLFPSFPTFLSQPQTICTKWWYGGESFGNDKQVQVESSKVIHPEHTSLVCCGVVPPWTWICPIIRWRCWVSAPGSARDFWWSSTRCDQMGYVGHASADGKGRLAPGWYSCFGKQTWVGRGKVVQNYPPWAKKE